MDQKSLPSGVTGFVQDCFSVAADKMKFCF